MKTTAILLAVGAMVAAGCGKESERGGPGAVTPNGAATNGRTEVADKDRTFTLRVPLTAVNVRQGEQDEVSIHLNRGKEFREAVKVRFEAPAGVTGLTFQPATHEFRGEEDDLKVQVRAAANATVGRHKVEVKADPETGVKVAPSFEVDVAARRDADRVPPEAVPEPAVPDRTPDTTPAPDGATIDPAPAPRPDETP